MKKFITFVICALLCGCCAFSAFATDDFATAGDLFQYWNAENSGALSPYPDYVCGVFSTDGTGENLTFMVTKDEAGEAGKTEILDLVKDDSTVSFTYGAYSYLELREAQEEIGDIISEQGFTGSAGWAVDEMENILYLDIDSKSEGAQALIDECFRRFGDMFEVHDSEGFTITADSSTDMGMGSDAARILDGAWPWAAALVLIAGAGAFAILRRKTQAKAFADGGTITAEPKDELKRAIRNADTMPDESLDRKIFEKIDKL